MKISIGSDHRGYKLKEEIKKYLQGEHEVVDFGSPSEEKCDYPDIALPVAESVASGAVERGVLVCGTGIGMSIAANKVPGVRAALVEEVKTAEMTAKHNKSNVLCLSEAVDREKAFAIVKIWLEAVFEERHQGRLDKVKEIEAKYSKA